MKSVEASSIRSAALVIAAVLIVGAGILRQVPATATTAPAPVTTSSAAGDTAVASLDAMLRTGRAQLRFEERSGYLRSVLDHLHVPVESQVVTFSQASLHGASVTDSYPRAIFFNDEIAVAWAPQSSSLELAAYSRQRGPVFYTLEQSHHAPRFEERRDCLACHKTERTLGVPGLLVLSAPRLRSGQASRDDRAALIMTDHRTPLSDRWGGWYVTGVSRRWKHQGNRIGQGWLTSLYDQFDTSGYPTLYSDIVALMVLEHQARASNLISRAQSLFHTDPSGRDVAIAIHELTDYLLFADEAPFPAAIVGTSGFAEWFSSRSPRGTSGSSLYQLDLKRRLFRHPVSYMIYSDLFDALPQPVKDRVYTRLLAVLKAPGEGIGPLCGSLRESCSRCESQGGPGRAKRGKRYWQTAEGLCGDIRRQRPLPVSNPEVSPAEKAATLDILIRTKPDFRDVVQQRSENANPR
jgi:hypothetical protein